MKLAVVPHNDDESLWLAFTLLREKPLVVVVFDSFVQPARGIPGTDAATRRAETLAACKILGVECSFLGFRDDHAYDPDEIHEAIAARYRPDCIYAPTHETDGHAQHNGVALACLDFPVADSYMTYTRMGKSTGRKVYPEPEWIGLKLRALAEYKSQFQAATGCAPHFIDRPLTEYYL